MDNSTFYSVLNSSNISKKQSLQPRMKIVAGNGFAGHRDGGLETAELFLDCYSQICSNPLGHDLFVTQSYSHVVRHIDIKSKKVRTVAGVFGQAGHRDGNASRALFRSPRSILQKGSSLIVADVGNHCIRQIYSDGTVKTIAGKPKSGFRNGIAEVARFNSPTSICISADDKIIIADSCNHSIRSLCCQNQFVSTISGFAAKCGYKDGPLKKAKFNCPMGVCSLIHGEIAIADTGNLRIRLICDGKVTTLAGGGTLNGDGPNLNICFLHLENISATPFGDVLVCDSVNGTIQLVSRSGVTSKFFKVMAKNEHIKNSLLLSSPDFLCLTCTGDLFIVDRKSQYIVEIAMALPYLYPHTCSLTKGWFSLGALLNCEQSELPFKHDFTLDHKHSGSSWKLHKIILLASCPHLLKPLVKKKVEESHLSVNSLSALFTYCYEDRILADLTAEDICDFETLSTLCALDGLAAHLRWRLAKMLSSELSIDKSLDLVAHVMKDCESSVSLLDLIFAHLASKPEETMKRISDLVGKLSSEPFFLTRIVTMLLSAPTSRNMNFPINFKHIEAFGMLPEKIKHLYPGESPRSSSSQDVEDESSSMPEYEFLVPDYVIEVEDRQFPCHSVIIYARWPYFAKAMNAGLSETSSNRLRIPAGTLFADFVEGLIWYMYSNKLNRMPPEEECLQALNFSELFGFCDAQHLPLPGFELLMEYCKSFLNKQITVDNCITALQAYKKYHFTEETQAKAKQLITKYLPQIMAKDELYQQFLTLSHQEQSEIMRAWWNRP